MTIKPSKKADKKIDVFKSGKKVASVGATGYMDYGSYINKLGLEEANKKRKNYLARHAHEPKLKDGKRTNSFYADEILW